MVSRVAIVSVEGDLHALAVEAALRESRRVAVHLLQVDRLCNTSLAAWTFPKSRPRIRDSRGNEVPLDELGAVWWRRTGAPQKLDDVPYDEAQRDLIDNDWRAFFKGTLLTAHRGRWISHPDATERASLKLWQLERAAECGFRVPRTLASNDPTSVRQFLSDNAAPTILKPLVGTRLRQLYTQFVDIERLDDECVRIVPALYQEYVPGNVHLRVCVFGCSVFAVSITTADLDWRPNLNVPVSAYHVDSSLEAKLLLTLRTMNLAMGIFDIKLLPSGEPVWLEVNPQGQFLFLESLSTLNLLHHFTEFLISSARETEVAAC
jgi:hypothetical protein